MVLCSHPVVTAVLFITVDIY